jgi:hypothetical protein
MQGMGDGGMKVHWKKIPECFHFVAMDVDRNVIVTMKKPELRKLCTNNSGQPVMDWLYPVDNTEEILKDFRYLIEGEEYELDGTEDWKTSLQERPKE